MEVHRSDYLLVDFFPAQELMESTWLATTNKMTDEEYKQELLNYREAAQKFRPKRVIIDTRNLFFVTSPELQEWTNQTIFPAGLEVGLKDIAFVLALQISTQLSVEQTMGESEGRKFNTRYFNDKEEAKNWLLAL